MIYGYEILKPPAQSKIIAIKAFQAGYLTWLDDLSIPAKNNALFIIISFLNCHLYRNSDWIEYELKLNVLEENDDN